ncbi:MFS transporter [Novosphingobium flavum]|uniref:MFS transporter n=1 Tax=Novosphingobium flavum TaxID=1778672 RepID=A0A7X1FU41_9SPHN|nr:MFS transporter [Novosphingobium flavum]MBC2667013.1 MFS transporter [Novosphingobium flavum]
MAYVSVAENLTESEPNVRPWPAARYAWGVAILLSLANAASHADRVVINLTISPLKAEFALTDTQFGALQGLAFGLFYMVCSVPLGRLADTFQRRYVLGVSLALFSMFSMASGLARSFGQLFATRVGVGIGEASMTPTGMSLLSDLFPAHRLGRAASLFYLSTPLGLGLAFVAGGKLLKELNFIAAQGGLPFGLEPWQACFLILGFPGLLLVPAFLMLREPERRGARSKKSLSMREVAGIVRERALVLSLMFVGFSMVPLINIAFNTWTPALFERVFDWTPAQFGIRFGLVLATFGVAGVCFAGWLSDRLTRAGYRDAPLRVAALCFIPCGIFSAAAPLMPNADLALAMIAPAIFLSNVPLVCGAIGFQLILPNRARAQVTGLFIMVTGLVGHGLGPVIIGMMNDHVFTGLSGIRYSMSLVVGTAAPTMALLLLVACKPYARLREAMEAE